MLEGIERLNTNNFDAGKSYHRPDQDVSYKMKKMQDGYRIRTDDAPNFSPFAEYLREVKWDVKEFTVSPAEIVYLTFVAYGLEFKTEVDIPQFRKIPLQKFAVSGIVNSTGRARKITANLSIRKDVVPFFKSYESLRNYALEKLMANADGIGLESSIDRSDVFAMSQIIDGINDKLYSEISNITIGLYKLLEATGRLHLVALEFANQNYKAFQVERVTGIKV